MAQVVVIDTDIDDTWALAFALRCPGLEVRLVTTSTATRSTVPPSSDVATAHRLGWWACAAG